jgi:hypothetical protein
MRVMVFMKMSGKIDPTELPATEAFEAMDRFTEELVSAGVFVAGAGLKPMSEGRRIEFQGDRRTVLDGPFTEAHEVIAGFSIWEVKDMEEAVAWVKRCPTTGPGPGAVELRPFYEVEDLAGVLPPEPEDAKPRDPTRVKLGVA